VSASRRAASSDDSGVELIFLLAATTRRRALLRGQARDALARADFGSLAQTLAARRLLALIGTRAIEAAPEICPAGFRAAVAGAVTTARARALAVEAETRRAVGLLERAGIGALPLKGPLWAADLHGDPGLRDTGDVDLLVPRDALYDAAHLFEQQGYSGAGDPLRANGLPDLHLRLVHDRRPALELHWRVHWYEEEFSDQMLARSEPGADGLLRPRVEDMAASLLLFYARDGFHGARAAADIAAWSDRHGEAPGLLEDTARRHPALAPALTAAARAAEHVTGAPAPAWLGDAAARGRRVALAARLADWRQTADRDQMAANISLADGLLAPTLASRDVAQRQLTPREGSRAPHAAKMLGRYATALWQIRRGRRWAEPVCCGGR
jgi:hypothetical protein